jgi:hypothetical protein
MGWWQRDALTEGPLHQSASLTGRSQGGIKKAPPDRSGGAFCLSAVAYLQRPVLMVFSVQLATELTSAAAPRTVLHAATVRLPTMVAAITSIRTMVVPPLSLRNDNGWEAGGLSS